MRQPDIEGSHHTPPRPDCYQESRHGSRMRFRARAMSVVLSTFIAASCSKQLSRSEALSYLIEHPEITTSTTLRFTEGQLSASEIYDGAYGALIRQGLATATIDGADPRALTYTFSLSDGGKTRASSWRRDAGAIELPVAGKRIDSITGMVTASESEADVEFTWQWQALFPHVHVPTGTMLGNARFRRYDDGWRLQHVSLERAPTAVPVEAVRPTPISNDEALEVLRKQVLYVPERRYIPVGIECLPRDSDRNYFADKMAFFAALGQPGHGAVAAGRERRKELVRLRDAGLVTLTSLDPPRRSPFQQNDSRCRTARFDAETVQVRVQASVRAEGWVEVPGGWWADKHGGFEIVRVTAIESLTSDGTLVAVTGEWRYIGVTDAGRAAGVSADPRTGIWKLVKFENRWGKLAHTVPPG